MYKTVTSTTLWCLLCLSNQKDEASHYLNLKKKKNSKNGLLIYFIYLLDKILYCSLGLTMYEVVQACLEL